MEQPYAEPGDGPYPSVWHSLMESRVIARNTMWCWLPQQASTRKHCHVYKNISQFNYNQYDRM